MGAGPGAYSGGQALFSAEEPTVLLDRMEEPFIQPSLPHELTGQYASGTTFIEGLVYFRGGGFCTTVRPTPWSG